MKWQIQFRFKGDNIIRTMVEDLSLETKNDVKKWFLSVYMGKGYPSIAPKVEFINCKIFDKKVISREEFHKLHKYCPNCGNEQLMITCAGYAEYPDRDYIDKNSAVCKKWTDEEFEKMKKGGLTTNGCGWAGFVYNLVGDK